jgi:sugar lactone lactonase YvrE
MFWLPAVLLGLFVLSSAAPLQAQRLMSFPSTINLPNGWLPEGIVVGTGPVIYSGSRANGAIYAADLRTGTGRVLVPGVEGRVAVGLSFDPRSQAIFVAGGNTGQAYVHSATTGETLAIYTLTSERPTFINDVIVTANAAYFTDSNRPVLYRLPLGPAGALPAADAFETIPLSGDFSQVEGFNANGIEATANGDTLFIVHSTLGVIYAVDPQTGVARTVDLGGASVTAGDGLLLEGNRLSVVRNRLNEISVFTLAADYSSATLVETISDPGFDVPTTIAAFGNRLYAVNGRFTTPPTPDTPYTIVQVRR